MNRQRSVIPWVWTGVVAAASLALLLIGGHASLDEAGNVLAPTLYTALGSLILTRQPENRISWLFLWVGMAGVPNVGGVALALGQPHSLSTWELFAVIWSGVSFWDAIVIPLLLLLFLFPTGRFLTRRWSLGGWVAAVIAFQALIGTAFLEEFGPPAFEWTIRNPIGFIASPDEGGVFWTVFGLGLIALMVGGVTAMVVRYRRSPSLVRTQIKWAVYAVVVFVFLLGLRFAMPQMTEDAVANLIFGLSLALIPISITVAIIRYRLFEIDRIISRTLGYGLVIVALGLVYVVGAVWLPTQLIGGQPPLFVAASTLAVAALFNPMRTRILAWVDRRFYRSRYHAEQVVDQFADRLRNELDMNQLTEAWVAVVTETMQPSAVRVWVKRSPTKSPDM